MAAEQPPRPDRTVRVLVLLIAGGAALFVAVATVVSVVRAENLLHETYMHGHNCCGGLELTSEDARSRVAGLGSGEVAFWRIRAHLALPRWLVSNEARAAAVCLLGEFDEEAFLLASTFRGDPDDKVRMTAEYVCDYLAPRRTAEKARR